MSSLQVLADSNGGLLFKNKRDRKVIDVDPKVGHDPYPKGIPKISHCSTSVPPIELGGTSTYFPYYNSLGAVYNVSIGRDIVCRCMSVYVCVCLCMISVLQ